MHCRGLFVALIEVRNQVRRTFSNLVTTKAVVIYGWACNRFRAKPSHVGVRVPTLLGGVKRQAVWCVLHWVFRFSFKRWGQLHALQRLMSIRPQRTMHVWCLVHWTIISWFILSCCWCQHAEGGVPSIACMFLPILSPIQRCILLLISSLQYPALLCSFDPSFEEPWLLDRTVQ